MRPEAFWAACWQRWGHGRDHSGLAAAPSVVHVHLAESNFERSAAHGRSHTAEALWPVLSFPALANTHGSHQASAELWHSALVSPPLAAHLPERKEKEQTVRYWETRVVENNWSCVEKLCSLLLGC